MPTRKSPGLAALMTTAVLAMLAPTDAAAIFRAYLSLAGDDANPCSLQQPCRLLPAALTAVDSGGEIWMLDSANFNTGPVTVTKSVTILAVPGALGSVVANGGHAMIVNAASIEVTLRNLNFRPLAGASAFNAIEFSGGNRLLVEKCNIFDFSLGRGLNVTAADSNVAVFDSVFRNNQMGAVIVDARAQISGSHFIGGQRGVWSLATASAVFSSVFVNRSVVANTNRGFSAESTADGGIATLYVNQSVMESNGEWGIGTVTPAVSTGTAWAMVRNSLASASGFAVYSSGAGARIVVSGNAINNNLIGLVQQDSSLVETTGDNTVRGNQVLSVGTITPISKL